MAPLEVTSVLDRALSLVFILPYFSRAFDISLKPCQLFALHCPSTPLSLPPSRLNNNNHEVSLIHTSTLQRQLPHYTDVDTEARNVKQLTP